MNLKPEELVEALRSCSDLPTGNSGCAGCMFASLYEPACTDLLLRHSAYQIERDQKEIADAKRVLADMDAADVAEVVHEKWLLDRWPSWPHRECSRCKIMIPRTKEVPDQYWQYCPNCGARMDGGNDNG